jgi:outer membrane immunogenic protein
MNADAAEKNRNFKSTALALAGVVSGAAWAGIAATAPHAAELLQAPVYKAPAVAPFGWAGLFIGAHGGFARLSESATAVPFGSSLHAGGGFGGGQIGYNTYLTGNWVLGSVLDLSAGDLARSAPRLATVAAEASSRIDYFGTARARLGYAFDHWLPYATAGTAWAHNRFSNIVTATGVETFGRDQFHLGWALGGGIEYGLDPNWSVVAEYLHGGLGEERDLALSSGLRVTDLTFDLVRFGVNYRFSGSAPPPVIGAPANPNAPAPVSSWTATFLGVHGGFGWGQTDIADAFFVPAQTSRLDLSGGFGGIETGYSWRFVPSLVFGLDSETSFGSLTQSGLSSPGRFAVNAKIDWFGSERVRLGFLADASVLVYGTGGLAWAHTTFGETGVGGGTMTSFDQDRIGWAGGAGVEWMFAPLWSARVEYLHCDLGTYQDLVSGLPRTDTLTFETVKLGIDWHGDLLAVVSRVLAR